MSEWISVKERLPDRGMYCAFMHQSKNGYVISCWCSKVDEIGWVNDKRGIHRRLRDIDMTHWCQIPEPPEGE